MKTRVIAIIFSILVILYLVSFGPGIYLVAKTEDFIRSNIPRSAQKVVEYTYLPHFYLMAYSESYFNYALWCVDLSGAKATITYPEFRKQFVR